VIIGINSVEIHARVMLESFTVITQKMCVILTVENLYQDFFDSQRRIIL
jgi:hypothetical protein